MAFRYSTLNVWDSEHMFIRPQLSHNTLYYDPKTWRQHSDVTPKCPVGSGFDCFSPGEAQEPSGGTDGGRRLRAGLWRVCPPPASGLLLCFLASVMWTVSRTLWCRPLSLPAPFCGMLDWNCLKTWTQRPPSPKFSLSGHRNVKVNSTFSSPTVFPKYCDRKTSKQTKTSWNSISKLELFRLSSWRRSGPTETSSKPAASTAL